MATFVLVHGAFYGGWCWRRVKNQLQAAGHEVWTPTLTGAGERYHLLSPAVDLNTHFTDVTSVFDYEDLAKVTLVGHSYGGVVITGVADRIPEKIARLVYVDATIPENNQAATGAYSEGTADALQAMAAGQGDDWLLPPIPLEAAGITHEQDVAWVASKRVPHSLRTLNEPIRLKVSQPDSMARTYIHCTQRSGLVKLFGVDPLSPFAEKARRDGYRFRELDAGHDCMVTEPRQLAELLIESATH